jgi:hypothetical protein
MIQYFEKISISSFANIFAIISAILSTNINAFLIEFESSELFLISVHELQNIKFVINSLTNQIFKHCLISKNCIIIIISINKFFNFISTIDWEYDDREFKNILVSCDAADRLIEDIEQFKALKRISNDVKLNTKTNKSSIKYDIDNTLILKFIKLNIPLEVITFHIVKVNTSFLLCLNNLNRLKLYFNNLINEMIQKISYQNITNFQINSKIQRHSVIRRYDHAFLLWKIFTYLLITEFIDEYLCLLIEIELRRSHHRFDHFSALDWP